MCEATEAECVKCCSCGTVTGSWTEKTRSLAAGHSEVVRHAG